MDATGLPGCLSRSGNGLYALNAQPVVGERNYKLEGVIMVLIIISGLTCSHLLVLVHDRGH